MSKKTENFLKHYGVQGMKWGVRKGYFSGKIKPRATLSWPDRGEQKWMDNATTKVYKRVYRRSQFRIRKGIRALNSNPKYRNQDFRKPSALRKQYYADYSDMVARELNSTVGRRRILNPLARVGQSPLRKFELHFTYDVNKQLRPTATIRRSDTLSARKDMRVEAKKLLESVKPQLKHADEDKDMGMPVELIFDDMGYIIDMVDPNPELEQTDIYDDVDDYLEHWGIPGMKWGFRKGKKPNGVSKVITKVDKGIDKQANKTAKKLNRLADKISGKKPNQSEDISKISDADLQAKVKRLQLEAQYKQLSAPKLSKGRQMLNDILLTSAKTTATTYVTKYMTKGVEEIIKKASKP